MNKYFKYLLLIFILIPNSVCASAGYLKKNSIVECNGELYGYHGKDNHWHKAIKLENGNYNADGDVLDGNPCSVSVNNDTRLLSVLVNGNSVNLSQTMEYITYNEEVDIKITAIDSDAKVKYDDLKKLKLGNNIVNIVVTSSDGSEKNYSLIIVLKEKPEFNVYIDDKKIEFDDYYYEYKVRDVVSKLKLKYDDGEYDVKVEGNDKFVTGKNEVKVIVTFNDDSTLEYTINVIKLDKFNSIKKYICEETFVKNIIEFFDKIF